jgi:hypothetical protein
MVDIAARRILRVSGRLTFSNTVLKEDSHDQVYHSHHVVALCASTASTCKRPLRDGYKSRRSALPGACLIKVLVVHQMIHTEKLRGLIRTITEHTGLQAGLGGTWHSIPCHCTGPGTGHISLIALTSL